MMKVETSGEKMMLMGLLTIFLCFAGAIMAWAAIPQKGIPCSEACHQGPEGGELKTEYQGHQGCVYCHSSSDSSTTYDLQLGAQHSITVPVVYYTGTQEPTTYLAGGNFYLVSGGGAGNDPKGHNVEGIAGPDSILTIVPGQQIGGNDQLSISDCLDCHLPFLAGLPWVPFVQERAGNVLICEDCHTPSHHADDSAVVVDGAGGWYRFLYEVKGVEDSDWEESVGSDAHNEYQGETIAYQNSVSDKGCACHGQYHALRNPGGVGTGSQWFKHPSDITLPSDEDKEYRNYTIYSPEAPVARPDLSGYTGPISSVSPGTDQVMCLSCHRVHGSPYAKILRWDFNGCIICHTEK